MLSKCKRRLTLIEHGVDFTKCRAYKVPQYNLLLTQRRWIIAFSFLKSELRYSNPFQNASVTNEGGVVCQFRKLGHKFGWHGNVPDPTPLTDRNMN